MEKSIYFFLLLYATVYCSLICAFIENFDSVLKVDNAFVETFGAVFNVYSAFVETFDPVFYRDRTFVKTVGPIFNGDNRKIKPPGYSSPTAALLRREYQQISLLVSKLAGVFYSEQAFLLLI